MPTINRQNNKVFQRITHAQISRQLQAIEYRHQDIIVVIIATFQILFLTIALIYSFKLYYDKYGQDAYQFALVAIPIQCLFNYYLVFSFAYCFQLNIASLAAAKQDIQKYHYYDVMTNISINCFICNILFACIGIIPSYFLLNSNNFKTNTFCLITTSISSIGMYYGTIITKDKRMFANFLRTTISSLLIMSVESFGHLNYPNSCIPQLISRIMVLILNILSFLYLVFHWPFYDAVYHGYRIKLNFTIQNTLKSKEFYHYFLDIIKMSTPQALNFCIFEFEIIFCYEFLMHHEGNSSQEKLLLIYQIVAGFIKAPSIAVGLVGSSTYVTLIVQQNYTGANIQSMKMLITAFISCSCIMLILLLYPIYQLLANSFGITDISYKDYSAIIALETLIVISEEGSNFIIVILLCLRRVTVVVYFALLKFLCFIIIMICSVLILNVGSYFLDVIMPLEVANLIICIAINQAITKQVKTKAEQLKNSHQ